MKDESNRFGKRLKELREQAGLTQPQLAERAKLSKAGIANLEQGRTSPVWATVQALCSALGVSTEAFNQEPAERAETGRGRPKMDAPGQTQQPAPKRRRGRPRKEAGDAATPPGCAS